MFAQADQLYARNSEHAGSIKYDLQKVHCASMAANLEKISVRLMIDSQSLSVGLRATAAFHEDCGKVLMANVPERAKDINEFTLLMTNMGTGKSVIFSHIMKAYYLKRKYDLIRESREKSEISGCTRKEGCYRHAVLNEITGPGLTKYLDMSGNVLVLIDEFDGEYQKISMFGTDLKSGNANSSAGSVLRSFHTGMSYYQKGKVSDSGCLFNPQVSFLAASNGAPVMDILKSKLKSTLMPDAMVMRTIFDIIDSPPKFNADYKNKTLPVDAISFELILLGSSLVSNQTYLFDTIGNPSADDMLQAWQDKCVAACARWKNVDKWVASRFGKTSELTARLAAQIAHIDLVDDLIHKFMDGNESIDPNAPVSYETYCSMMDFFHARYSPQASSVVMISDCQVEAAIYTTTIILLKFFNLFDVDGNRRSPIDEIPWAPLRSNVNTNPSVVLLPSTQGNIPDEQGNRIKEELTSIILCFQSVCFTISQISTNSKVKQHYSLIEPLLQELVNNGLLKRIDGGIKSGRNVTSLYVKILPSALTMKTVDQFVLDHLDKMKIPWVLYSESCKKLVLPSSSAILSGEANSVLSSGTYASIIEERFAPPVRPKKNPVRPKKKQGTEQAVNDDASFPMAKNTFGSVNDFGSISIRNTGNIQGNIDDSISISVNRERYGDDEQTEEHQSKLSTSARSFASSLLSTAPTPGINSLLPRPPSMALSNRIQKNGGAFQHQQQTDTTASDEVENLEITKHHREFQENFVHGNAPVDDNHDGVGVERLQESSELDVSSVSIRHSTRRRKKPKRNYSPDDNERPVNKSSGRRKRKRIM